MMVWMGRFRLVGKERWGDMEGAEVDLLIKEHAFHVTAADPASLNDPNDLDDATYTIVYPADLEPTEKTAEWHGDWAAREAAYRLMNEVDG